MTAPPLDIRSREIAALRAKLAGGDRLVSVVGPPGVGKSWLARAATKNLEDLGFGRFIDEGPEGITPDEIGAKLAENGRTLLLLDDLDKAHKEDVRGLLTDWLNDTTELTILTTSRTRWRARGEHLFELDPLRGDEAVALFEALASRWRPGFQIDEANRLVVEQLVEGLDRLPLAIELAAARAPLMTPQQMLRRLDQRFTLLGGDAEGGLHSAIAASWDALGEHAQRMLAQLSVFHGSFSFEAAEHVIEPPADAAAIIDLVQVLLERSLLSAFHAGASQAVRYRLLDTVRDFAAVHLDDPSAWRRHACFYAQAAKDYRATRQGVDDLGARKAIALDLPNLQRAFERARRHDPALGVEVGVGLIDLLIAERAFEEADAALAELPNTAGASSEVRAETAYLRATLAIVAGDFETAKTCAERTQSLLAAAPSCRLAGWLAHMQAYLASVTGRPEAARAAYQRAVDIFADVDLDYGVALSCTELGRLARDRGEFVAASRSLRRALDLLEPLVNQTAANRARTLYALTLADMGETKAALDTIENSLQVNRALPPEQAEPTVPGCAGFLYFELGQLQRADALFAEQLELIEAQGYVGYRANALLDRGILKIEMGDFDQAQRLIRAALELAANEESMSGFSTLGAAQSCLALINAIRGNFEEAVRQLEGADEATSVGVDGVQALAAAWITSLKAAQARRDDLIEEAVRLSRQADEHLAREAALDESAGANRIQRLSLRRGLEELRDLPAATAKTVLRLGQQARWLELEGRERVDLSRRGSMRRVLLCLARRHCEAPGAALSTFDLLEAGWPDDTVSVDAGTNRVYTTLSRLRSLGLEDVIRTNDEGYYLDEDVAVRWQ